MANSYLDFTTTGIQLQAALTTSTPQPSTSSPSTTSSSSHDGLSTAAQAGIGIGAALAGQLVVACIIFTIFLCRRRRLKHQSSKDVDEPESPYKPELPGQGIDRPELSHEQAVNEIGGESKLPEVDGNAMIELDNQNYVELGGNMRVELEGEWAGWEMGQSRSKAAQ